MTIEIAMNASDEQGHRFCGHLSVESFNGIFLPHESWITAIKPDLPLAKWYATRMEDVEIEFIPRYVSWMGVSDRGDIRFAKGVVDLMDPKWG